MTERFLIDECLSVALVPVAHEEGFEVYHVAHIGLAGAKDRTVFARVREEGFVFATNNRADFLHDVDLHAGLLVIVPSCRRDVQVALFRTALQRVAAIGSMVNKILEIDEGGRIHVYDWPGQ